MSQPSKNLLQYIGDDGEFLYPIDENGEVMLNGELVIDVPEEEFYLDLTEYHYPFQGSLRERWSQFVEYHELIHQLPQAEIYNLGLFAYATRFFRHPRNILILGGMITFVFITSSLGFILNARSHSDEAWLIQHSDTILNISLAGDMQNCVATPQDNVEEILVYRIREVSVYDFTVLDTQTHTRIAVNAPVNDKGWYQLVEYNTPGEGIVLAKYFDNLVCE